MISEADRYHGVVFRQLIAESVGGLLIQRCADDGRLNSYCLNHDVAIHIKHSTKRLTPWGFSFTVAHLHELSSLQERYKEVWLVFVCGPDGVVSVRLSEFVAITGPRPGGVASLRIDRDKRAMYRVFGNDSKLSTAKRMGVGDILGIVENLSKGGPNA